MRPALPAAAVLLLTAVPAVASPPADGLQTLRSSVVSGPSPYGPCAAGHGRGVEASPALLVDARPEGVDVVWQQDASHGAGGEITTASAGVASTAGDVGAGACAPAGRPGEVVSAPSAAVGPDGTRWVATAVTGQDRAQVVVARRSGRGAWTPNVVAAFDPASVPLSYLPPTVAVDPQDPLTVHVAYSRNHFPAGTLAVHRVSRDGGQTWSGEHLMSVGPTPLGYDFAEQLVALGGDRLLAISTEVDEAGLLTLAPDYLGALDLTQAPVVHRARTSPDGGTTWSPPVTVHRLANGGVRDRERGGTALRSLVRPSVVVGSDGAVHVAGESVAEDGSRTTVLLSTSKDRGRTWTRGTAAAVDGVALAASVAVDGSGRLAVSYLDLSRDEPGGGLDARWQIATERGGGAWVAQPLSDAFDLRVLAPVAVGDQGALVGLRRGFAAATVVGTGSAENPSDVVLTTLR